MTEAWHNGTATSAEAARKAVDRIPTQKEKVLECVRRNPASSRQEIADATGITLQAVCGRVATLIDEEKIFESAVKIGAYGTHVQALSIREPGQKELQKGFIF